MENTITDYYRKELVTLHLDNNLIAEIPADLATMPNLNELALNNNKIVHVPKNLAESKLEWLVLENNPIQTLPVELLNAVNINIVFGLEDMQEVFPGVYLGGQSQETKLEILQKTGITHILGLNGKVFSNASRVIHIQKCRHFR